MDIELLAKAMRERALLIEGDESLDGEALLNKRALPDYHKIELAKQKKREKLEEFKRLYFNAGRWVGGARDHVAREAYETMKQREK